MRKIEPLEHLSEKSKELWRRLCAEYPLQDAAAELLLSTALTMRDRAAECRVILRREGIVIRDAKGKKHAHPLLAAEAAAIKSMLAALHALNLDLEPLARDAEGKPRPGRRPGDWGNRAYSQTPGSTRPQ